MPCRTARLERARAGSAALLMMSVALSLIAVIAWTDRALLLRLRTADEREELIYLPPTRFLKLVSLGYQHALADVLWFRTISYFGRHYRSDRVYPWLASMCDAVTDLDPTAQHVYRFGGLILPWEAARIDDGIALLEKGSRNLPSSWELSYMLGFSYYFFKDDLAAAGQALQHAARLPNAPSFVARLAAAVESAHRGPEGAIEFLSALERGTNTEIRGAIGERIDELVLARDIDALDAAVATFQASFHRLPAQLTELLSARMLTAIPREPFGGTYVVDPATGHVHSSLGHQPLRLGSSTFREQFLKTQRLEREHAEPGT